MTKKMEKKPEDVLEAIRRTNLSEKKRQAAKFILDNYIESSFLTAAELASKASVSEPTVIRLATDLGFDGYPQLRNALQNKAQRNLTTLHRLKESHRLSHKTSPVVESMMTEMHNLEETLRSMDHATITHVIDRIVRANKILILGYKMSSCLAQFLQMALKKSNDNTVAVTASTGLFQEELVSADKQSVVIGISFPRYTLAAINDFEMACNKGLFTVAVTDSELSPLAERADEYLLARCESVSYVDAFSAAISLLNGIATAVSIKTEKYTLPRLERLEALWEEGDVFF